jgi:hypothetical protein
VLEFAAAELAALQQTTTGAGYALMGDALDLRHRLPRLWDKLHHGGIRVWQARKIAHATRHLSQQATAAVDAAVTPSVGLLPWGRLEKLLAAKIVEADPDQAAEQARLWEADRFVRTGRSSQGGLLTLIARANAGDIIWFLAMVNRIADLLLLDGDPDNADVRRSKAIGILAQPALALRLLIAHQHDVDSRDTEEPGATSTAVGHHPDAEPSSYQSVNLTPAPEIAGLFPPQTPTPTSSAPQPGSSTWFLPVSGLDHPGLTLDELSQWQPCPTNQRRPREPQDPASGLWFGALLPSETPSNVSPSSRDLRRSKRVQQIDPARLRPPAVLYVHISAEAFNAQDWPPDILSAANLLAENLLAEDPLVGNTPIGNGEPGVARFEGVGPITIGQARRFLGDTCQVRIQPVIDPTHCPPADSYEIPHRIREHVHHRNPVDVFPYGTTPSRHADLDHTVPYQPPAHGGAPGQTSPTNLGPLNRHHHRVKTHSRWRLRQPTPGTYLWRSPHGHVYLVTPAGTQTLGNTSFATRTWQAAARPAEESVQPGVGALRVSS